MSTICSVYCTCRAPLFGRSNAPNGDQHDTVWWQLGSIWTLVRLPIAPHADHIQKARSCATTERHGLGLESTNSKHLTSLIHQKDWKLVPDGDERTRAFRNTLKLWGAKDWVHAPPSPALQKHVPNFLFRTCMKFYTCTLFTNRTEQIFPSPRCSNALDEFSDHHFTCRCSSLVGSANTTTRHNRQVKLLADDLTHASRTHHTDGYENWPKRSSDVNAAPVSNSKDKLRKDNCWLKIVAEMKIFNVISNKNWTKLNLIRNSATSRRIH